MYLAIGKERYRIVRMLDAARGLALVQRYSDSMCAVMRARWIKPLGESGSDANVYIPASRAKKLRLEEMVEWVVHTTFPGTEEWEATEWEVTK